MEKIPAESVPWVMGASRTSQVRPRSGEWKTRAALPPVANQMLGSVPAGAEAPFFLGTLMARLKSCPSRSATMARQVLLAAKAASPSSEGGSWEGGIGVQ